MNRKNNNWLCPDPDQVPIVMSTEFPATLMVFDVVSNEDDMMAFHVIEASLEVNTEVSLNVLSTVINPWMANDAGRHPNVRYQAHTARTTQG